MCGLLHRIKFIVCLLLAGILSMGCSDAVDELDRFRHTPNTEPIRATVKTAVPLAWIAAVSMAAMQGEAIAGVEVVDSGHDFPSAAVIRISLESGQCPFVEDRVDAVLVAGFWPSPEAAVLSVFFAEADDAGLGVPSYKVSSVSTFPVKAMTFPSAGYRLVYGNLEINLEAPEDPRDFSADEIDNELMRLEDKYAEADDRYPEINIGMDAWVVEIADNGTRDNFLDDDYSISGGGQYINVTADGRNTASGVYQLGLAGIRISPACLKNPYDGWAVIQELRASSAGNELPLAATALFQFNDQCDGRVKVVLAMGNYAASTGSSIKFDLTPP